MEMLYKYFEIADISQEDIWTKRSSKRPDGSNLYMTTDSMREDLEGHGFYALQGQLYLEKDAVIDAIRAASDAQLPMIACIQWRPKSEYGHFVVIIGIEDQDVLYLDPEKDSTIQRKHIQVFIDEWQATGEEVVGGQFILASKDKELIPFNALKLTSFYFEKLKSFYIKDLEVI